MTRRITVPCIKVCAKERSSGWCLGCGRTGPEIARWWNFTDAARAAVLADLPRRLAAMGLPSHGHREAGLRRAREQSLAAAAAIAGAPEAEPAS
jgi:predicted Fe-S protein YdhL (DUF1289 family)